MFQTQRRKEYIPNPKKKALIVLDTSQRKAFGQLLFWLISTALSIWLPKQICYPVWSNAGFYL
ncbi:hypothetical protein F8388_002547 [Cannabis sativa]|uniref:Uncharacterized protein n=1 Tax=Cannabis sativa TaxID=3483 RepID=A0A7J6I132_CANSA|nr:hypothetical protein F8388_002547 [Cannabis sativa]KAF4401254.1 hypothetical protein G4B88_014095 [Cannabis sativa]